MVGNGLALTWEDGTQYFLELRPGRGFVVGEFPPGTDITNRPLAEYDAVKVEETSPANAQE